jgi:hypothetical protein
MRKYQLLKEAVLKITSHELVKENLTLYEEIKKSLKRLAQIKGNIIKPIKEV